MTPSELEAGIEARIRAAGPVIDPPAAKALYAPLLAGMPRGGEVLRDIAYGPDERHRLDVYLPRAVPDGGGAPLPVVVFLHGGGFIRGDKADREAVGHYFSRHGVLAVLPNYRLGPRHQWPAGAEDAAADHLRRRDTPKPRSRVSSIRTDARFGRAISSTKPNRRAPSASK